MGSKFFPSSQQHLEANAPNGLKGIRASHQGEFIAVLESTLVELKRKGMKTSAVNELTAQVVALASKIDELRETPNPASHFPALPNVLESPVPLKRKGTRNFRLNLPPVLTGSRARELINGCNEKNEEIASIKEERKAMDEKIKETRLLVAAEKKRAPRKRKGQIVPESELEVDLKDFLHRKKLMSDRLRILEAKPAQQMSEQLEDGLEEDELHQVEFLTQDELEEVAPTEPESSRKRSSADQSMPKKRLRKE